jgi:hypothetical protein
MTAGNIYLYNHCISVPGDETAYHRRCHPSDLTTRAEKSIGYQLIWYIHGWPGHQLQGGRNALDGRMVVNGDKSRALYKYKTRHQE